MRLGNLRGLRVLWIAGIVSLLASGAEANLFRFLGGTGSYPPNPFSLVELQTSPVAEVLIGAASFNPGLDIDPVSGLLYGASDHLRIIDSSDGSFVEIGPIFSATEPAILMKSIAFDPKGALFGTTGGPSGEFLYSINPATGSATQVGLLPGGPMDAAWGIDFAPDGTLYGAATSLQILNPATAGVLATIGPLNTTVLDIDFAPDGSIYALEFSTSRLLRVNPADASWAPVGTYSSDLWGLASEALPAIPEPSAWALFGLGALGLIAWRRRMNAA